MRTFTSKLFNLVFLFLFWKAIDALEKSTKQDCGGTYETGNCKWCEHPYYWYQPPSPPLSSLFMNGFCVKCDNAETQEVINERCFCYKKYAPLMSDWEHIDIDGAGNMLCLDIETQCGGLKHFPLYELGTGKHQIMICNQTKSIESGAAKANMNLEDQTIFVNRTIYQGASQELVNQVFLNWTLENGVTGKFKMFIPMELKTETVDMDIFLLNKNGGVISNFNPEREEISYKNKPFITYSTTIPMFKFQNSEVFDCEHTTLDMQTKVVCRGSLFTYPIDRINSRFNISISDVAFHKDFRKNNDSEILSYASAEYYVRWNFKIGYSFFIASEAAVNASARTLVQQLPCAGCDCPSSCQLEVRYTISSKMCKTADCDKDEVLPDSNFLYAEAAYIYLNSTPSDTFLALHEVWAIDNQGEGSNITAYAKTVKDDIKGQITIKIPMALPASEMGTSFAIKVIVRLKFETSRLLSVKELFKGRNLQEARAKAQVAFTNIPRIYVGPQIPEYTYGKIINYEIMTWVLIGFLGVALFFVVCFVISSMRQMSRMNNQLNDLFTNVKEYRRVDNSEHPEGNNH